MPDVWSSRRWGSRSGHPGAAVRVWFLQRPGNATDHGANRSSVSVAPVDVGAGYLLVNLSGCGVYQFGPIGESGAVGVRGGIAGKLRKCEILTLGGKTSALDSPRRIRILSVDLT